MYSMSSSADFPLSTTTSSVAPSYGKPSGKDTNSNNNLGRQGPDSMPSMSRIVSCFLGTVQHFGIRRERFHLCGIMLFFGFPPSQRCPKECHPGMQTEPKLYTSPKILDCVGSWVPSLPDSPTDLVGLLFEAFLVHSVAVLTRDCKCKAPY